MKKGYEKSFIEKSIVSLNKKNNKSAVQILSMKKEDSVIKTSPRHDSGFVPLGHAMSSLELDTGNITAEVTKEFFGQYFENVRIISQVDENAKSSDTIIVIEPVLSNFSYALPLTNLGFTMTPNIEFNLNVKIYKKSALIFDKTYFSGRIYAESSMGSTLYDDTSKTLHLGLFNLYKLIVKDIAFAIN